MGVRSLGGGSQWLVPGAGRPFCIKGVISGKDFVPGWARFRPEFRPRGHFRPGFLRWGPAPFLPVENVQIEYSMFAP